MSEWLDTETKAMLQQTPPQKLALPDTGIFALVLLQKGNNPTRIRRALARIPGVAKNSRLTHTIVRMASQSGRHPGAQQLLMGTVPILVSAKMELSPLTLFDVCNPPASPFIIHHSSFIIPPQKNLTDWPSKFPCNRCGTVIYISPSQRTKKGHCHLAAIQCPVRSDHAPALATHHP